MTHENFKLLNICGPHCVGVDEGKSLFDKISSVLKSGGSICLDFEGVVTTTSSFLNASIGRLFGQFENGSLEKRISWQGVDENDDQLIKLVIRNAKEHFAKSKQERKTENDIVHRAIEDEDNG